MRYFCTESERKASHSSCYLEFQKGEYRGNHWLEDSISLHDDIFYELHLYSLFRKAIPEFDHYGITQVSFTQWEFLYKLAVEQGGEVQKLIEELEGWLSSWFQGEDVFTICGI